MILPGRPGAPGSLSRLTLAGRVALVAVLLSTSCQSSSGAEAPLPPSPPVVVVTMDEYSFEYDKQIPSGRVVFRFVNDGDVAHQPDVVPLAEDIPPIDEQLRGDQRAVVFPLAGVRTRDPGETGTFAVDLAPGARYAIICFARNEDGTSHALLGMSSEFRAEGG